MTLTCLPYTLTPLATTGDRFVDFAPYVAAINDDGLVAFQATLPGGHSGVFSSDGQTIMDVAVTTATDGRVRQFSSHPGIDRVGALSIYGTLRSGLEALLLLGPDGALRLDEAPQGLTGIGPLGPTMNADGDVAYRATSAAGRPGVYLWRGAQSHLIAETGDRFAAFEGLPVVNSHGHVLFRADLIDGRQGLFLHADGACAPVALTGAGFEELARFAIMNDHGLVAFAGKDDAGLAGIFTVTAGRTACLVDASAGYESFRGVLINNAGPVVFYATPVGGQMGIYSGPDPHQHRLIGIGDPLFDSTVADFALNPVSVNEHGQLAIRVKLEDGRLWVLRADPVSRPGRG